MTLCETIIKSPKSQTLGYLLIILSAALFALTHVIGKPLLEESNLRFEINPIALAATIYIINGLFFTPFVRKTSPINSLGSKNLVLIGIIAVAEVLALITYFFGLKDSTAVNASIFSNGEIIFSLLIAITIFRERLQRNEVTPFFIIIFGMMILPVSYDFYNNGMILSDLVFGDILIILSGLLYAIDINICKYVSDRVNSKRMVQLVSFFAGCIAAALLITFQLPYGISFEHLAPISLISILGTGLAMMFFLISLRLIGAVRTMLIYSTTSIFGVIFSAIILVEQITLVNIISIVTVMVGMYLLRNRLGKEDKESDDKLMMAKRHTIKYKKSSKKVIKVLSLDNKREIYIRVFLSKIKSKILLKLLLLCDGG